jgi:hypothetical protein
MFNGILDFDDRTTYKLQVNDIFELEKGHRVYIDNFPAAFLYDNDEFIVDYTLMQGELEIGTIKNGFDSSFLIGKYIVTKTPFDGGGPNFDGDYPDGHHVYAKKLIKKRPPGVHSFSNNDKTIISNLEINFYQSGCFTCMIEDIVPIKKDIQIEELVTPGFYINFLTPIRK